jgi:uncharacterized delta-60 repeat protein
MEALEPRRLMDATAATVALAPGFGQAGLANPLPPNRTALHSPYSHLTPAADGKFYAITYGNWTFPPGYDGFELIRVNGDGSLDPTFTQPHVERLSPYQNFNSQTLVPTRDSLLVNSVLIQPDGKVIVVARDVPFFSPDPFLIMRFNTDGSPDQSFGTAGVDELPVDPSTAGVPTAWLTADGKIDLLNVGYWTTGDAAHVTLRQINADGTPDQSFGVEGQVSLDIPTDLHSLLAQAGRNQYAWVADLKGAVPLPDGGSVVYLQDHADLPGSDPVSMLTHIEMLQLRLDSHGNLSTSQMLFNQDVHYTVNTPHISFPSLIVQPDGKALILNAAAGSLARFNVDGTSDQTFNANQPALVPPGFSNGYEDLLPQADGTILVTVTDTNLYYSSLERLRPDGSLDTAFADGQPIFGFGQGRTAVEAVTLADGSLLASIFSPEAPAGYPYNSSGDTIPSIAKILPAGGTAHTFDLQAAEAAAQAAYDAAYPPYIPPTPDPTTTDGSVPVDTTTTGDPATDPTLDITAADPSTFDPSSDPLNGASLTSGTDPLTTPTGTNLFDPADGSTLFNPGGTRKPFDGDPLTP